MLVERTRRLAHLLKESTALYGCHVECHGNGACTLTPDSDLSRVSTKRDNIVLNPMQGETLVL